MIVRFPSTDGVDAYIRAVRVTPHFAVHPTPYSDGATDQLCWSATHIASGFAAISEVCLPAAVAAAIEFEQAGVDWDYDEQLHLAESNPSAWKACKAIRRKFEEEQQEHS